MFLRKRSDWGIDVFSMASAGSTKVPAAILVNRKIRSLGTLIYLRDILVFIWTQYMIISFLLLVMSHMLYKSNPSQLFLASFVETTPKE